MKISSKWQILGFEFNKEVLENIKQKNEFEIEYIRTQKFANQEVLITIDSNVEYKNILLVFMLPSGSYSDSKKDINEYIFELLLAIDTLKRMNVKSISLVSPYLPYSRQDRKTVFNESFGFKMLTTLFNNFNINKIITFDLHAKQTTGFFNCDIANLSLCWMELYEFLIKSKMKEITLVAPDVGSTKRISELSNILDSDMITITKDRPAHNQVEITNVFGDPKGKNCVIIDDMIDTGGTVLKCAELLKNKGAKTVSVLATHPIFSNWALDKFETALAKKTVDYVFVTNSLMLRENPKIDVIDLSSLINDMLIRLSSEASSIYSIEEEYKQKVLKLLNVK